MARQERCWPVLVHQLLAMALQFGAVSAERCWEQLARVPDFRGIKAAEFQAVVEHMKQRESLVESGGLLSLGAKAERVFGRRNLAELYAVFSSPVLYRVTTRSGRQLGSLEQGFVDRLVEQMSSSLLGGRAWTVVLVSHNDRTVLVRQAPRGSEPSWGGFIPSDLGFEVSQRISRVLTDNVEYPYVEKSADEQILSRRPEFADLLRRPGSAVCIEDSSARWWTFASGRINHTPKYGLELAEGWRVIANNFLLRIEGEGISHESVRHAITQPSAADYWDAPATRHALRSRLPSYRLSKFQDCLPEAYALEVIERFLLNADGARTRLQGLGGSARVAIGLTQ